ncbi:MAG: Ultraviolet N-glycosylase/AP lyase [bacterium ADurb.Bin363]|nr:MAG: Ultraviolet N-glycosylase/AP lyase [bacterium ADurb.Bin363]
MNKNTTKILKILKETYPEAKTALKHENPLQLLVATILSAQCTDERVNKVTPVLFKKYKTAEDFASSNIEELKNVIRSTGFFNQKARFIKEMAQKLIKDFKGCVPDTMENLIKLPGVARKTANVVLGYAFSKTEGIVVDTHVKRVSFRLGFTDKKEADSIEKDLMNIFSKEEWIFLSQALIWHGRSLCKARKPACEKCPLFEWCPSGVTFVKSEQ